MNTSKQFVKLGVLFILLVSLVGIGTLIGEKTAIIDKSRIEAQIICTERRGATLLSMSVLPNQTDDLISYNKGYYAGYQDGINDSAKRNNIRR